MQKYVQGEMIDHIGHHVEHVVDYVAKGTQDTGNAQKHQENPRRVNEIELIVELCFCSVFFCFGYFSCAPLVNLYRINRP